MKHLKQILAGGIAALSLTTSALAAPLYATPAEAAAGVTGKTLEEVQAERWSGKSYGTIAAEAGAEFQAAVWEMQAETLAAWVAEGFLTQEEADAQLDALQQRQTVCDGLGGFGCGLGRGGGFGGGLGRGDGRGLRSGCRNFYA